MASLQEIYGDNHQNDMKSFNQNLLADRAVSNIAARNFHEVRHNFKPLFQNGQLTDQWFQYIKTQVENTNPQLILLKVTDPNNLPYIINEREVTYMKIIDLHTKKFYLIFITPYLLDSY